MFVKAKAAFIDRDGVINEERNYVHRIEDFVLLPGVVKGLALLRKIGYRLIVVTNQAGIARGYYDQIAMNRLHDHMREHLLTHGVMLDAIYFCPHHPSGNVSSLAIKCNCRKPAPGMLLQAANDFDLDMASSVLFGDKLSDVRAGKKAGVGRNFLVKSGHELDAAAALEADALAETLLDAAQQLNRSLNDKNSL
jgi:D-glycero-D-manno-heptose 1,7-bisphosphate phosphatase